MRRSRILDLVAATIFGMAAAACLGRETATTTVTSGQGGTVTGTGATGGSTPETDMQGTGRTSRTYAVPREVTRPADPTPLPAEELREAGPGTTNDAGPRSEP